MEKILLEYDDWFRYVDISPTDIHTSRIIIRILLPFAIEKEKDKFSDYVRPTDCAFIFNGYTHDGIRMFKYKGLV